MFPQKNQNKPCGTSHCHKGYSVIEMLVVVAIIGILFSIAVPAYENYQDERNYNQARQDIISIQKSIDWYYVEFNKFPTSLRDIGLQDLRDPWDEPYYYMKVAGFAKSSATSKVRKDKKLKPVNSDYDLYSAGKDGATKPAFTAKASWDDIVRCNNGEYLGYARDY